MILLLFKKQICMEDGCMLSNLISLLIVIIMMFALCYIGYKTNEYKYYMRDKVVMEKNRKNKRGNKNDK